MKQYQMQIEMDGLISVLAENLYADPNVFIREMIQNGHDGIAKRRQQLAACGDDTSFTAEIRIVQDREAGTLTFCDNGAGLTQEEIHRYLSTIGGSDKRRLKTQADHQGICDMIGQFGIGMLSSFIVADCVEVLTRSEQESAFLWRNRGGADYTLEKADKDNIGTEVTLYLKSGQQRFLDASTMADFVRRYADIIGIPICLNCEATPLNRVDAPWHLHFESARDSFEAHAAFWSSRFPDDPAEAIWPLDACFTYTEEGVVKTGRVKGVLAVVRTPISDVHARPLADLYVSRMFIASGMDTLLPSWAAFVHAVIESPALKPNAARDNIMPDAALAAMKDELGRQIVDWLHTLAQEEPKKLRAMMRHHVYLMLSMCLQPVHRDFFVAVADMLPLESSAGIITMGDYLECAEVDGQGVKSVYYFPDADVATQGFMLAEVRKVQVINAGYRLVEEFLLLYASVFRDKIRLHKITADAQQVFEAVDESEQQRFAHVRKACDRLFDVKSVVSRFAPADVPFLLSESEVTQAQKELEDLSGNPAISGYLRDIMDRFVESHQQLPVLHINIDHVLINRLAVLIHTSAPVAEQVLVTLYNHSVLLYARRVKPKQVKALFEQACGAMELLLDAAELIEQQQEHIGELEQQLRMTDDGNATGRRLM